MERRSGLKTRHNRNAVGSNPTFGTKFGVYMKFLELEVFKEDTVDVIRRFLLNKQSVHSVKDCGEYREIVYYNNTPFSKVKVTNELSEIQFQLESPD